MGPNPPARRVETFLDILAFPGADEGRARVPCPHCTSPLTLHQPDPESPFRLIGICPGCKHWYLVDLIAGQAGGFLVGLPGDEVVRELSRADPSEGISLMGPEPDPKPGK